MNYGRGVRIRVGAWVTCVACLRGLYDWRASVEKMRGSTRGWHGTQCGLFRGWHGFIFMSEGQLFF